MILKQGIYHTRDNLQNLHGIQKFLRQIVGKLYAFTMYLSVADIVLGRAGHVHSVIASSKDDSLTCFGI